MHECPAPIIDLMIIPKHEELLDVIVLDSFEFEDSLGPTKASEYLCKGYTLAFSNGKSPHTSYLHDTLVLLLDYSLKNGMMLLFSCTCLTFINVGGETCAPCQELQKNKTLENILTQISKGVHENAGYAYYGFSALLEVLCRRTQQLSCMD